MERSESRHESFLLRLWRDGEGKAYRAMLERVDSHERHGFADVESLCTFLCTQAKSQEERKKSEV